MSDSQIYITAWLDRGCQRSARLFVESHRPAVRRAVLRWVPSEHLIEDIVQETFIKAFRSMHRLIPGGNVPAWLCTIARNTSMNYLRSWKRNIVRSATDAGIDNYADMLITIEAAALEDAEIEPQVDHLLSHLQQRDRQLLTMIHYENCTARDVGQRFGLSEGNVRVRLTRCHRSLRSQALSMRAQGLL